MKQIMKNNIGHLKDVKDGFSWTTFFFGFWVPLFRGDVKYLLIMIILNVVTIGLSNLVFSFIYNRLYQEDLVKQGYTYFNLPS
ncbi:MAG: DUF2628 domain-containing protein [Oscillospiraceae bacterium]|nr:DUF2628 domain-containing protein [Oscillospiraceae bacterium]